MKEPNKDKKNLTANEYTDVRDIKNSFIYTKSRYIVGILKIGSTNRDLMNHDEQYRIIDNLTAQFKPEKEPFGFLIIPRTVDMEAYVTELVQQYEQELLNVHRKNILEVMINEASETVLGSNNFEHQFYLTVWGIEGSNDTKKIEQNLTERLNNFIRYYAEAKVSADRLSDTELIRLCNLFSNGTSTLFENYEGQRSYIPIPKIQGLREY